MRFYVDTNIWIDYAENCKDKFRPLGEWAFEFFKYCIENKYYVLISNMIYKKIMNKFSEMETNKIVSLVKKRGVLIHVRISETQIKEANLISRKLKVPFPDAIHAVLARTMILY